MTDHDKRLAEIEERLKAATPGWKWKDSETEFSHEIYDESSCGGGGFHKKEDELLALHSRNDIPYLLAALRRARHEGRAEAFEEAAGYLLDHDDAFPQDQFRKQAATERERAKEIK